MKIDLKSLNSETLAYFEDALKGMSDADLIKSTKGMKDLLHGLKQDKPNPELLKQRIFANLKKNNVPVPILGILKSATLSDSFVSVLSEKALTDGMTALSEQFGRLPLLSSMLLDDRDSVRVLANNELSKPNRIEESVIPKENFKQRFKPFLSILSQVLDEIPAQPATNHKQSNLAPVQPLTKQQLENEIKKSSLYKTLQREVAESKTKLIALEDEFEKLQENLNIKTKLANELKDQCIATESNHQQLIAQGVADGLNNRVGSWLSSTEKLIFPKKTKESILDFAGKLLTLQEARDKRYGTRSAINLEIIEAKKIKASLIEAKNESLRPLPNLSEAIKELSSHIETLEKLLTETSIVPKSDKLQTLAQELQHIKEMDQLLKIKQAVEKKMYSEAWGTELCKLAYSEFNRKAAEIYDSHQDAFSLEKNEGLHKTAYQHFLHCLLYAKPLRLFIDGHNVLPKIKHLIGNHLFTENKGPNAEARNLLIKQMKLLTSIHPLIQADIWFDSPKENEWTEGENLRVWFSGGTGADRADKKILENLQSFAYRNSEELIFLATEDNDLITKGRNLNAIQISPMELWAIVN